MVVGVCLVGWLSVQPFIGAAAGGTDLGPYAQLANYGILGLIAIGFFQGRIVSAKHYDEMKNDRDQVRSELTSLRIKLDEQTIPALTRATDLMARLAERDAARHREIG